MNVSENLTVAGSGYFGGLNIGPLGFLSGGASTIAADATTTLASVPALSVISNDNNVSSIVDTLSLTHTATGTIANGIGTGLVESIDYPDNIKKQHPKKTPLQLDLDWRIPLMLNLKLKPSTLFESQNEEEDPVDFNWHCKQGLAYNIQTAKDEFCKKRGLKPVKIFITGPPASGKSYYGK